MKHTVTFQPSGKRCEADEGITVLDAARIAGEPLYAACGGQGVCGKCRVTPSGGDAGPATDAEHSLLSPAELAAGVRLACRTHVRTGLTVSIPEGSGGASALVLGADGSRVFSVEPTVKNLYVELMPPSASDPSADLERLRAELRRKYGLEGVNAGIGALRALHGALRDGCWKVTSTVRRGRDILRVMPGYRPGLYGASFDVGTTTIAGSLSDLETGRELASSAMTNPLVVMGDDVLSRVSYASAHDGGLAGMRGLLLDGLNAMLHEMAATAAIAGLSGPSDIMEVALVGNTVMHHILLGLPLDALGVSPFTPALCRAVELSACGFGLGIDPAGAVYSPPIVGGFIGSDTTAVMAAVGPLIGGGSALVLDIGTNGEIILVNDGTVMAASCATGPALEGAQISCGMRAAPGAIERAIIDPDGLEVSYRTVGSPGWSSQGKHTGAVGICGSGIVDIVAQMRRAGVLDSGGRLVLEGGGDRARRGASGEAEFVVAWATETRSGRDITVTQSDVRAVQLAKAAVAAGIRILLSEAGISAPDRLIVAGAFGNYLDVWNAAAIGMFPGCLPEYAVQAGNAAGDGARALLLSDHKRREAANLAASMRYVELSTHPDFQQCFLDAMALQ